MPPWHMLPATTLWTFLEKRNLVQLLLVHLVMSSSGSFVSWMQMTSGLVSPTRLSRIAAFERQPSRLIWRIPIFSGAALLVFLGAVVAAGAAGGSSSLHPQCQRQCSHSLNSLWLRPRQVLCVHCLQSPHRIKSNFVDRPQIPQGHLTGPGLVSMSPEVRRVRHWYAGLPGRFTKNTAAGGSR